MPVAKIWSNLKETGCSILVPEEHPEFDFKERDGWVTYNHVGLFMTAEEHSFHCLFYLHHRKDAEVDSLKQLIKKLCLDIRKSLIENFTNMAGGGPFLICHYHPFQSKGEDNHSMVRCIVEYELPMDSRKQLWLNSISDNVFSQMESFATPVSSKSEFERRCLPIKLHPDPMIVAGDVVMQWASNNRPHAQVYVC